MTGMTKRKGISTRHGANYGNLAPFSVIDLLIRRWVGRTTYRKIGELAAGKSPHPGEVLIVSQSPKADHVRIAIAHNLVDENGWISNKRNDILAPHEMEYVTDVNVARRSEIGGLKTAPAAEKRLMSAFKNAVRVRDKMIATLERSAVTRLRVEKSLAQSQEFLDRIANR